MGGARGISSLPLITLKLMVEALLEKRKKEGKRDCGLGMRHLWAMLLFIAKLKMALRKGELESRTVKSRAHLSTQEECTEDSDA